MAYMFFRICCFCVGVETAKFTSTVTCEHIENNVQKFICQKKQIQKYGIVQMLTQKRPLLHLLDKVGGVLPIVLLVPNCSYITFI